MAPTDNRNPVLLLHGIWDTGAIFDEMRMYLTQQGWIVHTLDMQPSNGDAPLELLAAQVQNYVEQTFAAKTAVDLVGFSMGGVVGRYYLQRLGGVRRIQRLVTLASPHRGTVLAYGSERPGVVQLRPDSAFLQDLNQDLQPLEQVQFTSIWTPLDAMIVPANSSALPVGVNETVWVALHAWMVNDRRCLARVAQALQQPTSTSAHSLVST